MEQSSSLAVIAGKYFIYIWGGGDSISNAIVGRHVLIKLHVRLQDIRDYLYVKETM
jgi:hypothetical protein